MTSIFLFDPWNHNKSIQGPVVQSIVSLIKSLVENEFLIYANCLMMLHTCTKICANILNPLRVIEHTLFAY